MGYLKDLCLTYDNNKHLVAENLDTDKATLLPLAHSTQNAQIEITIDENGVFRKAEVLQKDKAVTIIPVTDNSGSRGNGNNPHPLEDKLEYIAGDYKQYVGKDNQEKYDSFMNGLRDWIDSDFSNQQVKAIYQYLSKCTVMSDLIHEKVLEYVNYRLSDKKIEKIKQEESFVRFTVCNISMHEEECVYKNKRLFELYQQYYLSQQKNYDLCYVTGEVVPCSTKHPAKIVKLQDKAKLISANDVSGFTYRGRFSNSSQVASIGTETTQKAHNALRWLISKQGFKLDELSVVAWEISGKDIIPIDKSTPDAFDYDLDLEDDSETYEMIDYTNEAYARKLEKASKGYRQSLDTKAQISIMGVEAATIGRLSIRFYYTYAGNDYVDRVLYWHTTCFWRLSYKKQTDNMFAIGAPSMKEIAITAFGSRNDKLIKSTVERLIPCVIDRKDIPIDIIKAAVMRVSNPNSYDNAWEYNRALSVACAIIRKHRYEYSKKQSRLINKNNKEEYSMALDKNNQDRSYLFGRLLGAAQQIETYALYVVNNGEGGRRVSSAERYMQRFQRRPLDTWGRINDAIRPYVARLESMVVLNDKDETIVKRGRTAKSYLNRLQEIYDLFLPGDFEKKESLTEVYLLGYNCQLNSYKSKLEETVEN